MNDQDESGTSLEELGAESADPGAQSRHLNTNYHADVVLVAGLGGDAVGTWRADDEEKTVWPTSLLPLCIGDMHVRILTFRYNCTLQGSASAANIRDHANVLLVHLANQREDDDEAKLRPIVFVGHSLGGIIIKQTITFAYKNPRYKHLWEASRGIMFFSTPHYGMSSDLWYSFVRYVLQLDEPAEDAMPTNGMLATIGENSDELSNISEDFESQLQNFSFVTFIETEPVPKMNCVFVDKIHGRMRAPTEDHSFMEGDHANICKFESDDADPFLPVVGGIKNLIRAKAKEIDRLDHDEKKAYYSLASDETHSFFLDRKSTPGTCNWADDQPRIQAFLDGVRGQEDLWICGPPGCGKTFLAKHIISKLNPLDGKLSKGRKLPTVIHYFVSGSLPNRGHLQGLLRATAHQAIRLEPSLIQRLLPSSHRDWQVKTAMTRESLERDIWAGDTLKSVWPDIMAEVAEKHALAVVIDGFDELDVESRDSFLDCLQRLRVQSESPANLRLLFLSRNIDELDVAPAHQMAFQRYNIGLAETGSDITRTIDEALDRLWRSRRFEPGELREKIGNQIHLQSQGTYLWAALLSRDLDRNRTITSPDQVETRIQELPLEAHSIPGLYDYILDRLATVTGVSAMVRQALLWASVQKEGLKPAEFNVAQAIGRALEEHKGQQITQEMLNQYLDDKIAMTLDFHCGHIVKFQDGRLELVHGSLKEYIMQNGIRIGGPVPQHLTPCGTIAERLHAELARTCVAYLTMRQFQYSGPRQNTMTPHGWQAKVRARLDRQKFSRYASLYWDEHIRDAGMPWRFENNAARAAQQLLKDGRTEYARCWTEIWWLFRLWPTIRFPSASVCPVEDILPLDSEDGTAATTESASEAVEDFDNESASIAASEDGSFVSAVGGRPIAGRPPQGVPSGSGGLATEVQSGRERPRQSTKPTGDRPAPKNQELPMTTAREPMEPKRDLETKMPSTQASEAETATTSTPEVGKGDKVNTADKKEEGIPPAPARKQRLGWMKRMKMAGGIIVGGFFEPADDK
ncbi:uncharacterized protein B0H64DRAFT_451035 [Chaetomium fimeti]|uniref:Nephrocystin 3-like N-terminal domain-containing protein n=1 Tax=Chaetomium fimeti TaxID=1854472 RepID=A0AAE0LMY0_9PEZI|nr:hypothetical protein B0H64DRAFT_451035 [Chaetomium fimeti]